MPYPIPPWLTPPYNQNFYEHGADLGVRAASEKLQIQNERARMAQTANLEMMRLNQQQAESIRKAQIEEQQLEIEKSYKQQMADIAQQEAANKQRVTDMQLQEASRQFAARQRMQDLIQSGTSPEQALLQGGPDAFSGAGGFAQAYRALHQGAQIPQIVSEPTTGQQFYRIPTPEGFRFQAVQKKGNISSDDKVFLHSLESEARALKTKMNNSGGALLATKGDTTNPLVQEYLADKQQLESIMSQIKSIYEEAGYQYPTAGATPTTAGTATLPPGVTQGGGGGLTVQYIRPASE